LNRIEADCITENEGSLKIFKKLNMSYEGTRRQSRYNKKHDKYFDVCYYGLLREDYLNNN
jgi:RimJ/RimL family protein N-acetyltransferase